MICIRPQACRKAGNFVHAPIRRYTRLHTHKIHIAVLQGQRQEQLQTHDKTQTQTQTLTQRQTDTDTGTHTHTDTDIGTGTGTGTDTDTRQRHLHKRTYSHRHRHSDHVRTHKGQDSGTSILNKHRTSSISIRKVPVSMLITHEHSYHF